MTFKESKERCRQCQYNDPLATTWRWPCDECSSAAANLVEPAKDYFTPGRYKRRYCVEFTDNDCGIQRTMTVWGRTDAQVVEKFNHAYGALNYVINAVHEIDETEV